MDVELEKWRRQWQGGPSASRTGEAERLRRRVLSETRWNNLSMLVPVLVTIVFGGSAALRALRTEQLVDVVLAIENWIFIIVVWVIGLSLSRGTWRPLAHTTTAFVDVSIRRCESKLRAAVFGAYLYVIQFLCIVLVLAFTTSVGGGEVLTSSYVKLFGWVGVPSVFAALYWFRRRKRAELARLRELESQLRGD